MIISHKDAYCLRTKNDVNLDDIVCLIQDTISCIEQRIDLQFLAFRRVMLISLDMVAVLGNVLVSLRNTLNSYTYFSHINISKI